MDNLKEPSVSGKTSSNGQEKAKPRYFLLVDDNFADRLLLRRALEDNSIQMESRFIESGQDLVNFLNQSAGSPDLREHSLPCLIYTCPAWMGRRC